MGRLPYTIGEPKIEGLLEETLKLLIIEMDPTRTQDGSAYRVGQTSIIEVNVSFNVAANTEVTVDNPLGKIPTRVVLATLLDRSTSWYKGTTWTADTLGFKLSTATNGSNANDPPDGELTLTFWLI